MFNVFQYVAHAGEDHSDSLESVAHVVSPWYLAVPTFLLVMFAIGYLTWIISGKKPDAVLIVLALVSLVSGFTLFVVSPITSVIAITGGMIIAGILTFGGLSHDAKNDK